MYIYIIDKDAPVPRSFGRVNAPVFSLYIYIL